MHDTFKLKADNNEPIWYGWYPPHITIMDNAGEAWGTSSAMKGNDGVCAPHWYIFYGFTYHFF